MTLKVSLLHGFVLIAAIIINPAVLNAFSAITGADDEHLDKILEAAAELPQINAIILVANGSQVRKTMSIKNVFTLLRGHLPDAVLENTLAVLTNCSVSTRQDSKSQQMNVVVHFFACSSLCLLSRHQRCKSVLWKSATQKAFSLA